MLHAGHKLVAAALAAGELSGLDVAWVLARELTSDYPATRFGGTTRVLHADIHDFSAPTGDGDRIFRAQLDDVCEVLRRSGRVLVFCHGGRGRTAIALASIAIRLDSVDADTALARAHAACGGPEEESQRAYVRSLTTT